jgi:hypothetical protein
MRATPRAVSMAPPWDLAFALVLVSPRSPLRCLAPGGGPDAVALLRTYRILSNRFVLGSPQETRITAAARCGDP